MTQRILLLTHAPLASALRECALHVFADSADDVLALDVPATETPEATLQRALSLLDAHGGLQVPTLVLTDVLGATPCNVAQRLIAELPARLLTGVNLSMLLRSIGYRHEPLDTLVSRALQGGSQGIMELGAPQLCTESQRTTLT